MGSTLEAPDTRRKGSNPGLQIEPVGGQGVPDQGNSFYRAPEEEIHRTSQTPPRNSGGVDISARPKCEAGETETDALQGMQRALGLKYRGGMIRAAFQKNYSGY